MKLALLSALISATVAHGLLHSDEHYESLFAHWRKAHGVELSSAEYAKALAAFAENSDFIAQHNAAAQAGKHSYTLAHNEYSHMTWEDFRANKFGLHKRPDAFPRGKRDPAVLRAARSAPADWGLPDKVDWVEQGAVTSVKNQGMCGSCWAFSAVGALEGAVAIKHKKLIDLSEEMLVDCDDSDSGCGGGLMENAYDWIKKNGGICSAEDYPYTGILPPWKTCKSDACTVVPGTAVSGWTQTSADEHGLMAAVKEAPLAVAIEADQQAFQFYSDGVFNSACGTNLDHGVVLVGYGTDEESGLNYFKVKNSWGTTWGSEGYILLARPSAGNPDTDDECGIMLDAIWPILKDGPAPVPTAAKPQLVECGTGAADSVMQQTEPAEPAQFHHHHNGGSGSAGLSAVRAALHLAHVHEHSHGPHMHAHMHEHHHGHEHAHEHAHEGASDVLSTAVGAVEASLVNLWRPRLFGAASAGECPGSVTSLVFQDITVDPEQPERGHPVRMRAAGLLAVPVTGGKYELSVSLAGVQLYSHSGDVCGESTVELPLALGKIHLHGLSCPAAIGGATYGLDVHLPSMAPPGHYTIELTAQDQSGIDLMCLHADFKL